jgi:hypothetical protein
VRARERASERARERESEMASEREREREGERERGTGLEALPAPHASTIVRQPCTGAPPPVCGWVARNPSSGIPALGSERNDPQERSNLDVARGKGADEGRAPV